MKFSLKLADDQDPKKSPLLKAKIPVTIFTQPFTSSISAPTNSSSDLSFSLSTNFPSGPSLRLSYSPSSSLSSSSPFSLSLKSGLGLFGSPQNSPLMFSAHFSLSHTKPIVPTFSLQLKPDLGHFCLKKSTFSNPSSDEISGSVSNGVTLDSGSPSNAKSGSGLVLDEPMGWQELKLEPVENLGVHLDEKKSEKDGILSGVSLMARTVFPLTKMMAVNLRWGVNFGGNFGTKMPNLTFNKVVIERVENEKEVKKKKVPESDMVDSELLKGMYFFMRRDLEVLEKENKEMKKILEEIRFGTLRKSPHGENVLEPSADCYGDFGRWNINRSGGGENGWKNDRNGGEANKRGSKRSHGEENRWEKNRNGGEENGEKGIEKSLNRVSEVESELQRAIKAASH